MSRKNLFFIFSAYKRMNNLQCLFNTTTRPDLLYEVVIELAEEINGLLKRVLKVKNSKLFALDDIRFDYTKLEMASDFFNKRVKELR